MQGEHKDYIKQPLQASLQRLFQPVWEFNQHLNLLNLDAMQEIQSVGSRLASLQYSNAVSHFNIGTDSDGAEGLIKLSYAIIFDYLTVGHRLRNRLLLLTDALEQHVLHFRV